MNTSNEVVVGTKSDNLVMTTKDFSVIDTGIHRVVSVQESRFPEVSIENAYFGRHWKEFHNSR